MSGVVHPQSHMQDGLAKIKLLDAKSDGFLIHGLAKGEVMGTQGENDGDLALESRRLRSLPAKGAS